MRPGRFSTNASAICLSRGISSLARAQRRHLVDRHVVVLLRTPQVRKIAIPQPLVQHFGIASGRRAADDQLLALAFIRHRHHGHAAFLYLQQAMQGILHRQMRHHLTGDLAEARQAVLQEDETVFVDAGYIPGGIPAVLHNLGGFPGLPKITEHQVRPLDLQQAGRSRRQQRPGLQILHPHRHAGHGVADTALAGTRLLDALTLDIPDIKRDYRREFAIARPASQRTGQQRALSMDRALRHDGIAAATSSR